MSERTLSFWSFGQESDPHLDTILVLYNGQCLIINQVGEGFRFRQTLVGEKIEFTELAFAQFACSKR